MITLADSSQSQYFIGDYNSTDSMNVNGWATYRSMVHQVPVDPLVAMCPPKLMPIESSVAPYPPRVVPMDPLVAPWPSRGVPMDLLGNPPRADDDSLHKPVKRTKITVPKPGPPETNMELEDNDFWSETSSSIAEDEMPLQYRRPRFGRHGRGRSGSQGDEDYRRFSARSKKKPAFYGMSDHEEQDVEIKKDSRTPGGSRKRGQTIAENGVPYPMDNQFYRNHRRSSTTTTSMTTSVTNVAPSFSISSAIGEGQYTKEGGRVHLTAADKEVKEVSF